ncbi:hypothetical protein WCE55_10785 [Luteimonas sp. MJ293]|uniref:hypothetical protein n=1 Tax=Luteimonas sp. MJ146 TaxID=3129240 RepID=UPI0031BA0C83
MDDTRSSQKRGWVWTTLLVAMGAIYLTDGLREPGAELYRLLMGTGFLLMAPQAFFRPSRPAKSTLRTAQPVDWLAMMGVAVLIAGIVVRFL